MGTHTAYGAQTAEPLQWAETLRRWTGYMRVTGLSPVTIRNYRRTVINFVADTLLDLYAVTEDDIVAYVAELSPKGSMRGQVLKALRHLYSYLEDRELLVNPARRLKPKNPKYGEAPHLEEEQVTRLILAAAWRDPRRGWTLLLLYSTGARIGSLCALEPSDLRGGRIHFRITKNDSPYSVPASVMARAAFLGLAEYGFPTVVGVTPGRVRQWVDQASMDAGIDAWPHLFRHSFGTIVARRTDPRTWMELMNHRDLSQYRRYVARDEEAEKAAVEFG